LSRSCHMYIFLVLSDLRIDSIPCIARALLGEFSNLRLGAYTPFAHENRNQFLYLHFLHIFLLKQIFDNLRGLYGLSYVQNTWGKSCIGNS